jgi:mRNA-degrading endonuclease RelE of RelBE toxin-antitoxin system
VAIHTFLSAPLSGRELQFELSGYHSYRVRTYRIIYWINDDNAKLDVVFIGPRRTVYEELKSLLKKRE